MGKDKGKAQDKDPDKSKHKAKRVRTSEHRRATDVERQPDFHSIFIATVKACREEHYTRQVMEHVGDTEAVGDIPDRYVAFTLVPQDRFTTNIQLTEELIGPQYDRTVEYDPNVADFGQPYVPTSEKHNRALCHLAQFLDGYFFQFNGEITVLAIDAVNQADAPTGFNFALDIRVFYEIDGDEMRCVTANITYTSYGELEYDDIPQHIVIIVDQAAAEEASAVASTSAVDVAAFVAQPKTTAIRIQEVLRENAPDLYIEICAGQDAAYKKYVFYRYVDAGCQVALLPATESVFNAVTREDWHSNIPADFPVTAVVIEDDDRQLDELVTYVRGIGFDVTAANASLNTLDYLTDAHDRVLLEPFMQRLRDVRERLFTVVDEFDQRVAHEMRARRALPVVVDDTRVFNSPIRIEEHDPEAFVHKATQSDLETRSASSGDTELDPEPLDYHLAVTDFIDALDTFTQALERFVNVKQKASVLHEGLMGFLIEYLVAKDTFKKQLIDFNTLLFDAPFQITDSQQVVRAIQACLWIDEETLEDVEGTSENGSLDAHASSSGWDGGAIAVEMASDQLETFADILADIEDPYVGWSRFVVAVIDADLSDAYADEPACVRLQQRSLVNDDRLEDDFADRAAHALIARAQAEGVPAPILVCVGHPSVVHRHMLSNDTPFCAVTDPAHLGLVASLFPELGARLVHADRLGVDVVSSEGTLSTSRSTVGLWDHVEQPVRADDAGVSEAPVRRSFLP